VQTSAGDFTSHRVRQTSPVQTSAGDFTSHRVRQTSPVQTSPGDFTSHRVRQTSPVQTSAGDFTSRSETNVSSGDQCRWLHKSQWDKRLQCRPVQVTSQVTEWDKCLQCRPAQVTSQVTVNSGDQWRQRDRNAAFVRTFLTCKYTNKHHAWQT